MIDRMQTIPVLVTLRFTDDQLATLRSLSPRVQVEQRVVTRDITLADVLDPSIVVLYAGGTDFPLSATPNLRWIQLHNAGVEHIYNTEAWRSDIPITSMTGIHAVPIAEYVIGLMLAWAHHVPRMLAYQSRAEWATNRWANFVPRKLRGMTLGLVGYGAIGRSIAQRARGFEMNVIAVDAHPAPDAPFVDEVWGMDRLPDLLRQSDVVAISAPLVARVAAVRLIRAGSISGSSPCTLTTIVSSLQPCATTTSARRSVPLACSTLVRTARRPCPCAAASTSRWSVATTTSSAPERSARSATRTTIGLPPRSSSGLAGRRVDA